MGKDRFEFGKNWKKYINNNLDESRIVKAEKSLLKYLPNVDFKGKKFLDIGSGSGLFSLAAKRLGATVYSFDYDQNSVQCTKELKDRYFPNNTDWVIEQGDILNEDYLAKIMADGKFDIVYSWGVLHHTGSMYQAIDNAQKCVADDGHLYIAIYNDQGWESKAWKRIKKLYNKVPGVGKSIIVFFSFIRLWGPTFIGDLIRHHNPFYKWKHYGIERGMSPFVDLVDWVGGYPFEYAKPEEIIDYLTDKNFKLLKLFTCSGGVGCNEFSFEKVK
ncbi:MAG: class I SAM-dependent methyltransferase [Lachnospiraceae bacterium]|nr:class I SAM-dependent methyltransferase [Lachnospiraceae bacterium]